MNSGIKRKIKIKGTSGSASRVLFLALTPDLNLTLNPVSASLK
jgi:hypothetical protein